ncbi:MAG: TIGR03435 family protein [Bryobacteraceae bacterium]|jgi:uncharacterized protein (TIGR03435 family)
MFGQTSVAPGAPAFDVASIKPAPKQTGPGVYVNWSITPGRVNYENVSLTGILTRMYSLQSYQLVGPAWLSSDGWDIAATMPADTPRQRVWQMFETLLAERFKLTCHREDREMPVYALIVAKNGAKLKAAEQAGGLSGCRPAPAGTACVSGNVPMDLLASYFSRQLGRPVLDKTELKGPFIVELEWAPSELEQSWPAAAWDDASLPGSSIFSALEEQLGLNLEARKAPVQVLVIDHCERVPTGN